MAHISVDVGYGIAIGQSDGINPVTVEALLLPLMAMHDIFM